MNIVIDSILVLVLTVIGYIQAINYLNEIKWNKIDLSKIKIQGKNKVIYLVIVLLVSTILITLFQVLYIDVPLIEQIKLLTLVLILFPTAAVDYKTQKIPNVFMLGALIIRVIYLAIEFIISPSVAFVTMKSALFGAVIIGGFFLIILLLFKNSIGMGDIKLFGIMGLYQGLNGTLSSVFCSLVVSFFLSIILLITRKKGRKDAISFAPSILIGTIISIGMSGM